MKEFINRETTRLYDAAYLMLQKRGALSRSDSTRAWKGYERAFAKFERAIEALDAALSKARAK
jgi:hypothetical protein